MGSAPYTAPQAWANGAAPVELLFPGRPYRAPPGRRHRSPKTTAVEQTEAAVALRPLLLARAFELTRSQPAAEDLVQDTFERYLRKPPAPRSERQLHHWLRTTMGRLRVDAWRREQKRSGGVVVLPLEEGF